MRGGRREWGVVVGPEASGEGTGIDINGREDSRQHGVSLMGGTTVGSGFDVGKGSGESVWWADDSWE